MTAPEPGSGPSTSTPIPQPSPDRATGCPEHPPDGWRASPFGWWEPDPDHPLYPFKPAARSVRDDHRNLDESPKVRQVLAAFQAAAGPIEEWFFNLSPDEQSVFYAGAHDSLTAVLKAAGELCGSDIASPFAVQRYLRDRGLRPETVPFLGVGWELDAPVWLRFYPQAGQFLMRFSEASGNERGKLITPLIEKVQAACRYPKPRPGANRRQVDAKKAEQARTAIKLHHWFGMNREEVGAFLGFDGDLDTITEHVRTFFRDGEVLMATDPRYGPGWKLRPPPAVAAFVAATEKKRNPRS